uniref:Uncharacterized protein n=1 Tax=Cacopsylla melanoneura TaxID=428564 RepID=A0A8D8T4M4_9HEMI
MSGFRYNNLVHWFFTRLPIMYNFQVILNQGILGKGNVGNNNRKIRDVVWTKLPRLSTRMYISSMKALERIIKLTFARAARGDRACAGVHIDILIEPSQPCPASYIKIRRT